MVAVALPLDETLPDEDLLGTSRTRLCEGRPSSQAQLTRWQLARPKYQWTQIMINPRAWGYGPSGIVGVILVVVLILFLLGTI
jgi:hypothetical protein